MTHIRGLPGALPADERLLWQGRPCWRSLARRLCHVRGVALYWVVVVAGAAVASAVAGGTAVQTALTVAPLLGGAAVVLGFLCAIAYWIARTTEYSLTTRRVVIRFGMALPATLAIPHRGILRAAVMVHGDHTGDLPIETKPGFHVLYRRAWPHVRPWRLGRPQPMLRSVPQAGALAALLARTLATAELERRREAMPHAKAA